jgi:hypothetical protein
VRLAALLVQLRRVLRLAWLPVPLQTALRCRRARPVLRARPEVLLVRLLRVLRVQQGQAVWRVLQELVQRALLGLEKAYPAWPVRRCCERVPPRG